MKSDSKIKQDVLDELKWEPAVEAALIGVEVKDGVVTLAGQVDSYSAKWNAERAAQRVSGVKALAVEMKVAIPGYSARTDADIARSVKSALEWTTYLGKDTIKVMVEGGMVTLTGDVEWEYQRQAAEVTIRHLLGVTGVSNEIAVRPKVSMVAVKSDIEIALKRRASADAKKISVTVKGSSVTLSGSVHSWSERELARQSAWSTPGVTDVVDNISVSYA